MSLSLLPRRSASIGAISENADCGLDIARSAASDAERTNRTIQSLYEAADWIGSVASSQMAAQTNLLVLNAKVEAATLDTLYFQLTMYCPACRKIHKWTRKNAWVDNGVDERQSSNCSAASLIPRF